MKIRLWVSQQFKKKARIYILPTRMGGYLNGLIFLMFLLAVGYSNNLLLIFTLFMFGLNLIWVIQTHFHLNALKLGDVQLSDNFAGEITPVSIHWKKCPHGPYQWKLTLDQMPVASVKDTQDKTEAHLVYPKRGIYRFHYLKVETEMPFGLYKTWIYFPIEALSYAYPSKLKDAGLLNSQSSMIEGEVSSQLKGPHDVWNLGPYQGDESRKISWKHYARSGELVVKEGEELTNAEVKFKLSHDELELSQIATQMVYCSERSIPFSLTTSHGTEQGLKRCLVELAKC